MDPCIFGNFHMELIPGAVERECVIQAKLSALSMSSTWKFWNIF
jgi:hypothetical protein